MNEYNLTLKVRNNLLLRRMRMMGIETAAELSRRSGASQAVIGEMLNLTAPVLDKHGKVRTGAQKVCDALHADIEDIMPEQHLSEALAQNRFEAEVSASKLMQIAGSTPESALALEDQSAAVEELLGYLTPRERKVIDDLFGFSDGNPKRLQDVGKELDVTGMRIRQIHDKALRKLRGIVARREQFDGGDYAALMTSE